MLYHALSSINQTIFSSSMCSLFLSFGLQYKSRSTSVLSLVCTGTVAVKTTECRTLSVFHARAIWVNGDASQVQNLSRKKGERNTVQCQYTFLKIVQSRFLMTFYQINENANQKRKHTQQENETKLKNSKDLKEDENLNTAKMT